MANDHPRPDEQPTFDPRAGHERSITREAEGEPGFVNAYGPGNETGAPVGAPLPGSPLYSSLDRAVTGAENRSGGVSVQPSAGFSRAPTPLASYAPEVGSPQASRLNANLGLPSHALTPTLDMTPLGQQRSGERQPPSQDAVRMSTEDYLAIYPDAVSARQARDKDPGNVELRNAEHFRFAQELMKDVGPLGAGGAILGYAGLKALAQGFPSVSEALFRKLKVSVPTTTDKPLDAVKYGIKGMLTPEPSQGAVRLRGRFGK